MKTMRFYAITGWAATAAWSVVVAKMAVEEPTTNIVLGGCAFLSFALATGFCALCALYGRVAP
jgi:hypothetical protein